MDDLGPVAENDNHVLFAIDSRMMTNDSRACELMEITLTMHCMVMSIGSEHGRNFAPVFARKNLLLLRVVGIRLLQAKAPVLQETVSGRECQFNPES
jgi:hypothetical protein